MLKKKQLSESRKKSIQELRKSVSELKKKSALLEVNLYAGREPNLKSLSNLRHEIAQILGIIADKEREEVKTQKEGKK